MTRGNRRYFVCIPSQYSKYKLQLLSWNKPLLSSSEFEKWVQRVRDKLWSSGNTQKHKKSSLWKLSEGVDCFQCGKQRHQKGMSCAAKGITCHACRGMNHMGKVCVKSVNSVIVNKGDKNRRIQAVNTGH